MRKVRMEQRLFFVVNHYGEKGGLCGVQILFFKAEIGNG